MAAPRIVANEAGDKMCPRCNTFKPLGEYHRSGKAKAGVQTYCKECQSQIGREALQRDPERRRVVEARSRALHRAETIYRQLRRRARRCSQPLVERDAFCS